MSTQSTLLALDDVLLGRRVMLTGARGMLAGDLVPLLKQAGAELILSDLGQGENAGIEVRACDVTKESEVESFVQSASPDWIINCAAYTKVDDAEREQEIAFKVNAIGPGNLAAAAAKNNSRMMHISSDYVFGGEGSEKRERKPISEETQTLPCGIYGQSKRFGDELVRRALPQDYCIARTSWLHGVHGPSFVAAILRLAAERDELRIVDDQIGSPTWTVLLSEVIISLIARDARGIFNVSSRGDISWFDFAKEIVALSGRETKLGTQTTEELARPAPRPAYSTLSLEKLESFLGIECPSWQEGLRGHLQQCGELKSGGEND